jgi:hypothetical protein
VLRYFYIIQDVIPQLQHGLTPIKLSKSRIDRPGHYGNWTLDKVKTQLVRGYLTRFQPTVIDNYRLYKDKTDWHFWLF